jgi:hypothetical protein
MKVKRYLLRSTAFILLLVSVRFLYTNYINPKSPKGLAEYINDDIRLLVEYSRPSKKGRLIFGAKKDNALVPFGDYWRLGANKATTLTTNRALVIDTENLLPAGKYRLYAIPHANYWDVVLHNQPEGSGATIPDPAGDLFDLQIKTIPLDQPVEQFTIDFVPKDSLVSLRFRWDKTSVSIPIKCLKKIPI